MFLRSIFSTLAIGSMLVLAGSADTANAKPPKAGKLEAKHFGELRRGMTEDQVRSVLGNPSGTTVPVLGTVRATDKTGYCLEYDEVKKKVISAAFAPKIRVKWIVAFSEDKAQSWSESQFCYQHFQMNEN